MVIQGEFGGMKGKLTWRENVGLAGELTLRDADNRVHNLVTGFHGRLHSLRDRRTLLWNC